MSSSGTEVRDPDERKVSPDDRAPSSPDELTPEVHVASTFELLYRVAFGGFASVMLISAGGYLFFREAAQEFIGPVGVSPGSWAFAWTILLNNMKIAGLVIGCVILMQVVVRAKVHDDFYVGVRTFCDLFLSITAVTNLLLIGIAFAAWPAQIFEAIFLYAPAELSAFIVLAVLYTKARRRQVLPDLTLLLWIAAAVFAVITSAPVEGLS